MTKQVCNHSIINHFFYNILCPHQTLIKRVANIAAAPLLLLGAAWLIYSAFFKNRSVTIAENRNYSLPTDQLCHDAVQFAYRSLQAYKHTLPNTQPIDVKELQPVNPTIGPLIILMQEMTYRVLRPAIERHESNPWQQPEVLAAANRCMKISYALSRLILDDLYEFAQKPKSRSNVENLTRTDSYQRDTFLWCSRIYHAIRAHDQWDDQKNTIIIPDVIPDSHAASFYQPGTLQNTWNRMYNDFCLQVRRVVVEQELSAIDNSFADWIQYDTGSAAFNSHPRQPS